MTGRVTVYARQMRAQMDHAHQFMNALAVRDVSMACARGAKRLGELSLASDHVRQAREAHHRLLALLPATDDQVRAE